MTVLCDHGQNLLSCDDCIAALTGPPSSAIRHVHIGTFRVCEYDDGRASAKCLACSTAHVADDWDEAIMIAEMGHAC